MQRKPNQLDHEINTIVLLGGGVNPRCYDLDKKLGIRHVMFEDSLGRHDSTMEIRIDNKILTVDMVKELVAERANIFA